MTALSNTAMMAEEFRKVDGKGRVTLGDKFANRTVIIRKNDETEVVVTLAQVIPEREVWLHKNKDAMALVQAGLAQAASGGKTKHPPKRENAAKWVDELEG